MKAEPRCLALSVCILWLLLLFVCPQNLGAGAAGDKEMTDVHQRGTVGAEDKGSDARVEEGEEEYGEETEGESECESAPTDAEERSSPGRPPDKEEIPLNPRDDDDMASLQTNQQKSQSRT